MSEGMDEPRLAAEGELALARLALDVDDLRHAAGHTAAALAHAPTMPEVHELLARLAARADGAVDLFPLDRHAFVGAVVARAHLLAAVGEPADGLELLVAATGHAPQVDWAGVAWVTAPGLAERLEPGRTARLLMQLCAAVPDPAPVAGRAALLPYLTLARHCVTVHAGHGLLLGAASALARRLGETELALDWAARGVAAEPSKLGEVWLGYAHRSAGQIDEALAALGRAVGHEPDDLSVYADIAGTLADNGRLDEALEWIERALARDPAFDCAVHTAHRLRYRRDGALAHLVALADFQREHPDDSHEHADLAECCHGQPWLGQVPAADETVLDTLRRVLAGELQLDGGPLRISAVVSPSATRTVSAALPTAVVEVAGVPGPDPREPRRPVERRLWRYRGTEAVPALPAPSASAVRRIHQLAHPVWAHPPAVYDAAVALATVEVDDLLALLVHPPAAPPTPLGRALTRADPSVWVRSVQVWACLGLLHHRTDEAWPESARRRTLLDLVWGVEDWITEAALFALVTAAWVDPTVRADVRQVVAGRLADHLALLRHRPAAITTSLARLALATPGLDAQTTATARALLAGRAPAPVAHAGPLRRLWRRLHARATRTRSRRGR